MSEKLSSEKEKLILENQRLVYYLVQKLGIQPSSSQYEDIASIGTIGLIKAAKTFDSSKKIAFATYASRCINNEIFMYYRKAGKYASEISLDEPLGTNKGAENILLGDMIEDEKSSDYIEKIEIRESFCQVANIILNCLKGIEKCVMFYKIADMNQQFIAKILGISQSYVSRIYNRSINKIK